MEYIFTAPLFDKVAHLTLKQGAANAPVSKSQVPKWSAPPYD